MSTKTFDREKLAEFLERSNTHDSSVRQRMIRFIKKHHQELLGKDIHLLDQPGGLDKLAKKYRSKLS